jgi:hypothetical protein
MTKRPNAASDAKPNPKALQHQRTFVGKTDKARRARTIESARWVAVEHSGHGVDDGGRLDANTRAKLEPRPRAT